MLVSNSQIQSLLEANAGSNGFVEDVTVARFAEVGNISTRPILEQCLNEIYIVDAETLRFEFVNEGAFRNLGYSFETLRQMTPADINPRFDLPTLKHFLSPLRNYETESMRFQATHRRADGTEYDVEVHLRMSMNSNRPVFLAMMLDISERVALESKVFESTELQRAIIDNAAYAIVATTPTGACSYQAGGMALAQDSRRVCKR